MNSSTASLEQLKYPIGQALIPDTITKTHVNNWIETLEQFPNKLTALVSKLTDEQLNTSYRDKGWTIRQVVHHVADSHHNSYIRFKWALTEYKPVIKAYFEDRWAELHDSIESPILLSLNSLSALHAKWVYFLKGLSENELNSTFIHPETKKEVSLKENIGIYAWHCDHHYAHIENLLVRKGWK